VDSREGAIVAWEDGLAASECALERVCMKRNTEHVHGEGGQQDFYGRMHASSSKSIHFINLNWILKERL
jgi:hypothetical protein